MKRKGHAALIAIVFAGFFVTTLAGTARASIDPATSTVKTKVLVFIQAGNTPFKDRIELDDRLEVTYENEGSFAQIDNLGFFDVYLVCGYLPSNQTYIQRLNDFVNAGKGLFIFGGYYPILAETGSTAYDNFKNRLPVEFKSPFTTEEELYLDQDWVVQIELKVNDQYLWNEGQPLNQDILQRSVVWESSPLVKERIFVKDARADAKVLVYKPEQNRVAKFTKGEPLVAYREQGSGKILWVSMVVGPMAALFAKYITQGAGPYWERVVVDGTATPHYPGGEAGGEANKPFYLWPYFNYFLFQSVRYLDGLSAAEIDTYAQWPYSPIPHETEATLWMIFVAGLWVFNFVLFFTLGRKKKAAGREVVAEGPSSTGEKELTAEERKALEDAKPEDKPLITEEKKPSEDEKI
ncbi:MAG: hypothetical protein JW839_17370 [Candidatus Lokiarchaeota archaeon]|nr:hypothetical protein [Candidatus Lokiarchaeota archaeon]